MSSAPPLRLLTYLAPSLPRELFEAIGAHLGRATGREVSVRCETRLSAPPAGEADPLSTGEADLAFLCAPGYRRLSALRPSPVVLLPAAPVFDDPRAGGRPVYFADVIVRRADAARRFADLLGRVWAWNDAASWSGRGSVLEAAARHGARESDLIGRTSGSHLASLRMVVTGEVDAAAIDSNALRLAIARDPSLASQLRVVEAIGPHAIQPVVARASLPATLRATLTAALLRLHEDPTARAATRPFGLARFAAVSDRHYAPASVEPSRQDRQEQI